MPGYVEYEEILRTYNPFDIALVKSLLDPERIDYFFRDEFFSYAQPWTQPSRLMVRTEQAFEAREILRDLTLSYSVSSGDTASTGTRQGERGGIVRFPCPGDGGPRDPAPGARDTASGKKG
ncbi:MAG: DUF2007 domain-containing protein [Actinomycetota bacterium]